MVQAMYSSMRRHPQLFDATAHMSGCLHLFAPGVRGTRTGKYDCACHAGCIARARMRVSTRSSSSVDFAATFLEEIEQYARLAVRV